jgi:hypothetical protein
MRETLISNGRAGAVALTMALSLLGAWTSQGRAETLRWKLGPGEVLRYTMEQKQLENFQVMGKSKKSTRLTTTNLSWTVKSLSPNGEAEITLRFDRVRMRIEQPPLVPLEFDSSPNKLEIPDEFEPIERQLKATAGAELTFKLRPTGEVDDLKVPEQTMKKLRDGLPKDAPGGEPVSEEGLKAMLMSSKFPSFPPTSLEPGMTWTAKTSKISLPIGSLTIDQVFTFQGPDSKAPRLLLVGIDAKVSLEPAENVLAKIRKHEGTGSLTFDAETGRIVRSSSKQKMELIITDRGQDIVQSSDTTTTMTLEP